MDFGAVDRSATRTDGPLRAASPVAKLIALALVVATVLVSWNLLVLASVLTALLAAAVWGRVDLKLAVPLAAYPALFALAFAFASAPSALAGAVIVMKSVTAASATVLVVLTTPYPQIFAPIQRITPAVVGDALLMTYRATFIMLEKFSNLVRAVRLRSGLRGASPLRALRATASAIGGLLLYSIDLAQRDYDVMRLRGYEGRLRVSPMHSRNRLADVVFVGSAVCMLAASILWRMAWTTLNPYSWLALLPALSALAAATIVRKATQ